MVLRSACLAVVCMTLSACGDDAAPNQQKDPPDPGVLGLSPVFRSEDVGCTLASPLWVRSQGQDFVLSASMDGVVRAYDPESGAVAWSVTLPAPSGRVGHVAAPPVLFDDSHLVVAFQHAPPGSLDRDAHRAVVIDLEARALDPAFPELDITGSGTDPSNGSPVPFLATNEYSRSALVHASAPGSQRGYVYVSYGNVRDLQPWHGWVFELDLDAWSGGKPAISGTLLTTHQSDCGPPGVSGANDMLCGAGVWAPAGPLLIPNDGGDYQLIVPTGNGHLDLDNGDWSNALLRTGRGLPFVPGCDATACAGFDGANPTDDCLSSCKDLFVPRLLPGDSPLKPASGACDGKSLMECYAELDWDFGANTPVAFTVPGGPEVMLAPGKDGYVYLLDAAHMGTLYDRMAITDICGAAGDVCTAGWAGMIVTQPKLIQLDGEPVALIPTFMFDKTHPAGVVAVRTAMEGGAPKLSVLWRAPDRDSAEAKVHFRRHTSRMATFDHGGTTYALVQDQGSGATPGTLYAIRAKDGFIVERRAMGGPGVRYQVPLVVNDTVYVHSCAKPNEAPGHLEAYRIVDQPARD